MTRQPWDVDFIRLWHAGHSLLQIGYALGIPHGSLAYHARRLGLHRPRSWRTPTFCRERDRRATRRDEALTPHVAAAVRPLVVIDMAAVLREVQPGLGAYLNGGTDA